MCERVHKVLPRAAQQLGKASEQLNHYITAEAVVLKALEMHPKSWEVLVDMTFIVLGDGLVVGMRQSRLNFLRDKGRQYFEELQHKTKRLTDHFELSDTGDAPYVFIIELALDFDRWLGTHDGAERSPNVIMPKLVKAAEELRARSVRIGRHDPRPKGFCWLGQVGWMDRNLYIECV